MKEHEARLKLPGSGDIAEKVNEIDEDQPPEHESWDAEKGEALLQWLLSWLADET